MGGRAKSVWDEVDKIYYWQRRIGKCVTRELQGATPRTQTPLSPSEKSRGFRHLGTFLFLLSKKSSKKRWLPLRISFERVKICTGNIASVSTPKDRSKDSAPTGEWSHLMTLWLCSMINRSATLLLDQWQVMQIDVWLCKNENKIIFWMTKSLRPMLETFVNWKQNLFWFTQERRVFPKWRSNLLDRRR